MTGQGPDARNSARPARHRERHAIFASAMGRPRHLLDSVRRRLVLVLVLALAPITILTFSQGLALVQNREQAAQERLLRGAASAAGQMEDVFLTASSALANLARLPTIRQAAEGCADILAGAVAGLPFAGNIALLDQAGTPLCSARADFQPVMPEPSTTPRPPVAGLSLHRLGNSAPTLLGLLPLDDPAGRQMAMEIKTNWLSTHMKRELLPPEGIIALLDTDGTELASNAPAGTLRLFPTPRILKAYPKVMERRDEAGQLWSWTLVPLRRDGLTAAFALPTEKLMRRNALTMLTSFAMPALIAMLSLIALWVAIDSTILRWLLYLRRVTAVYAQGHYGFRPTLLKSAPSEFRVLGHAVEDMASAVRQRDARLRANLAEKTALVREIHHRIKNSLQIVVSLISLYGAGLHAGEDRQRFEQLRIRINTLALVHRILHEAMDGSRVHLGELLREMAGLLENSADQPMRLSVEVEDAPLSTDMAVPLALMVAELVLDLLPLAASSPAQFMLEGAMREGKLQVCVGIHANADRPELTDEVRHIMNRADLAQGFAGQLGGSLCVSQRGSCGMICASFPPQESQG
ncbi:histidine kinase dimerization/phosphoacceptor domain -containing protein [Xanthobacter sp. TB0139]|uniref:histidine kinase dimerization/phosphoacceptor domain -containing protein n=1 Tax=Xanthobacter sp. TB0139 TaxID=3459178 RepID=UPI00403A57C4